MSIISCNKAPKSFELFIQRLDNVDGDQSFLELVSPTLKENVQHIKRNATNDSSTVLISSVPVGVSNSSDVETDTESEISPSSTISMNSTITALRDYQLPEGVQTHVLEKISDITSTLDDLIRLTDNDKIYIGFDCKCPWKFSVALEARENHQINISELSEGISGDRQG
ncbi:hypothetical protein [Parasitella parasitica]|uniref:Uncharacterized protein n=1 Tax=Parasitella parasitica TaxID=35722 RepID=A0A0B7N649_9FUNG|nr:hypothetical protein [Parasitella parasitica]